MYTDISHLTRPLPQDNLSKFFASLELSITGFGTWEQTDVRSIRNFMITDYEIIYMLRGETEITWGGKACRCTAGDAVLFEPFQMYSAECRSAQPVQYMYLHFNVEPYLFQQELAGMLRGDGSPVYSGESFASFHFMVENLCAPAERAMEGHALLLRLALQRMLLAMIRQRRDLTVRYEPPRLDSQEAEIISRAVAYVMTHMDEPVRVAHIAAETGVSENKLYKSFMDILHISPSRYFLQLKIKRARELLRQTDHSVEEISVATGFSSAFHLSRTFKEMLGVSPSQLRKQR